MKRISIHSIFPENDSKNTKELINKIAELVPFNKWVGYAGYSERKYLKYSLERRYKGEDVSRYKRLSEKQILKAEKIIRETFEKCNQLLKTKHNPTFFFVFPWFPEAKTEKIFGGVMGWVDYQDTVNLYLSQKYNSRELVETVAHEYNHAIWYHYHDGQSQTLLESMIIEGLAEHFREQSVGGKIAPWCKVFTRKGEIEKVFKELQPFLDRTDRYEQVFFGNKMYKKWTGYSVGYWLVKQYVKTQKKIDWNKVMKYSSDKWKKLLIK